MSEAFSVVEAADRLRVSVATIRRMILNGELPNAYKSRPSAKTSPYVIPLTDIAAVEEQRRASTKAHQD